jgi:hypothetical protein
VADRVPSSQAVAISWRGWALRNVVRLRYTGTPFDVDVPQFTTGHALQGAATPSLSGGPREGTQKGGWKSLLLSCGGDTSSAPGRHADVPNARIESVLRRRVSMPVVEIAPAIPGNGDI